MAVSNLRFRKERVKELLLRCGYRRFHHAGTEPRATCLVFLESQIFPQHKYMILSQVGPWRARAAISQPKTTLVVQQPLRMDGYILAQLQLFVLEISGRFRLQSAKCTAALSIQD